MSKHLIFMLVIIVTLALSACSASTPEVVEVTRQVEVQVEVPQEVEVTRQVEVQVEVPQEVEVEVTRIVEVEPEMGDPIKVGFALANTGFVSLVAQQEREGALLLINQVNQSGGINGRPIEVIARDTASEPQRATEVVQEMAREGVVAIVGPATSGESIAAREFANDFNIPIMCICGSPAFTSENIDYAYRFYPNSLLEIEALINYVVNNLGGSRIAFLNEATAFGEGALSSAEALLESGAYDFEIVAREVFQTNDTDMTAQLLSIQAAEPDAIISYGTGLSTAVIMRQKEQLGVGGQLITSPNGGQSDVVEAAEGSADNTLYPSTYCDNDPGPHQEDVTQLFLDTYGKNLGWPGLLGWSTAQALVDALQRVADSGQEITGETVKVALDELDMQLAMGQMSFTPDLHELADPNEVLLCEVQGDTRLQAN